MEEAGGGLLTISTRVQDDSVILEFSDNGPGAQDPQRVFDPFYTTRPVGQGIGLGLSACYGIIQEHRGRILCHNRPEGGAVFRIELPSADPVPRVSKSADDDAPSEPLEDRHASATLPLRPTP